MRKTLMITAAVAALGAAAADAPAAMAGEAHSRCAVRAGEAQMPAEAIRRILEDLGYRVDRVKLEHGCYEARAANDSGIPIEVRYHPATGELVRARLRS